MTALIILLALGVAACDEAQLQRTAFSTVETIAVSVDVAMTVAGDLYKRKIIHEVERDQISTIYTTKYQPAARAALEGIRAWKDKKDVAKLVEHLLAVAREIEALVSGWQKRSTP